MEKKESLELNIERLLTIWGLIVVVWSVLRANFPPPLWFSEFIAKPLVFIGPVLWFVSRHEKTGSLLSHIGFPKKDVLKEFGLSLLLLFFVVLMGFLSLFLSKELKFGGFAVFNFAKLGSILSLAFASSISEEILGRGFLFNYLYKYTKSFVMSLFVSSALFFILYLPNALTMGISGYDLFINLLLNFSLSFITATAFFLRKNIFAPIAIHASILLWFDLFLGGM
ncbi:MAG: hypothetical protein ACD_13C00068G0002 [uncultured bacterium]|nr:MAG: hypothetical protein ACD_13C00068G0002 [uncultured bacterium]